MITLIGIGLLFYFGEKEPVITVTDDTMQIESIYDIEIDFVEIKEISLLDKSMNDIGTGARTNGYGGLGQTLKGNFEEKLLFVHAASSPTILIERDGKKATYISFKDEEKTKALYEELTIALKE